MDPRDQTFMTIHNLTLDANILFASDSIFDILGYQPDEVQGRSCFDYFHPEEVPFARSVHSRGVLLDKAAVLHYARILSKDGRWVSCECCFTVVHDVLVASTSIYLGGEKSQRRALEAPQIRRMFACSSRDPRYHMLEHLSPKFKMPPMEREPRAALILNRFTRNLSIMFATNAVSTILGVRPEEIKDKSFYECIQENCLQDAIQCLESAKANESIAYLRFSFRDPRTDDDDEDRDHVSGDEEEEDDEDGEEDGEDEDEDEEEESNASTELDDQMDMDEDETLVEIASEDELMVEDTKVAPPFTFRSTLRSRKAHHFPYPPGAHGAYQAPLTTHLSTTMPQVTTCLPPRRHRSSRSREPPASFELEAVVSCTSDGLVVVLRKARPPIPAPHPPLVPTLNFENGLFAAPWGQQPIHPHFPPDLLYTFRPPLLPKYMPLRENVKAAGGPPLDQLMRSIRDVAVFAWALVGINGNIATYAQGSPKGATRSAERLASWGRAAGSTTGYSRSENPGQGSSSHLDDETCQTRTGRCCHGGLPYSTQDMTPHNYNQAAQQPREHHAYTDASPWRSSSSLFDARSYEQEHSQYQHHEQNRFLQNSTHHHHSYYHHHHHHHYHEQQQLPQQQPPFIPGRSLPSEDLPREPWVEAPSSQAHRPQSRPVSSTQTPQQLYSNYDFRYMWQ